MADTIDVDINVNTETGELDILAQKLSEVTGNEDVNVNVNVDEVDELTSKLQSATDEVEKLEEALDEAHINGDDIEADMIADQLAEATAEAEILKDELDNVGNTPIDVSITVDDSAVDDTESKVEGLDGSTVNVNVNVDNSGVDETKESVDDTTSSVSSLGLAVSGLAATAGFEQMAAKADSVNTSWNQLSLTFGGTSSSMANLKASTEQAAQATGRAGSTVRGYFNDMGVAGVTNTNLLSQSFQALAGKSYQTGNSIESMEQKMKTMVMSGNAGSRQLTQLGISSADLARVMGVSADQVSEAFKNMTPEERLQAITKAMGDGKSANDMYKQSFAGMKEQMGVAIGGLMAAIGQGILPTVIPIVKGVTGAIKTLGGAFKALPGPVQGVVGGFGGFVAVGATAVGTLGTIGKVGSGVADGLKSIGTGYNTLKDNLSKVSGIIDKVRNSEKLMTLASKASSAASTIRAGAEGALTAVKSAAIGPTTGLAIAENSLLLPLLLIVGAIVAVVAIMWYLYNTNEGVRNAINGFADAVKGAGKWLMDSLGAACEWVQGALGNLGKAVGGIGNVWDTVKSAIMAVVNVFRIIIDVAGKVLSGQMDLRTAIMIIWTSIQAHLGPILRSIARFVGRIFLQMASSAISAAGRLLSGVIARIAQIPALMYARLMMVYAIIYNWGMGLIQRGIQAARNFVNSILNPIKSLPGMIQSAVSSIANILFKPFQDAWNKIKPIVDSIKNAVSSVTGWMGDDEGGVGYYSDSEGVPSLNSNLNTTLSGMASNSTSSTSTSVNNNFYGLVEESAADYIIQAVNDRLRKEKIIKGV